MNCFCLHVHWEATLPGAAGPALVAALLQATGLWPLVWGIIAACLVVAWMAMFDNVSFRIWASSRVIHPDRGFCHRFCRWAGHLNRGCCRAVLT